MAATLQAPETPFPRRSFLKAIGFYAGGLALRPPPPVEGGSPLGLARATIGGVGLYREPAFRAPRLLRLERDALITLVELIRADEGPAHNPRWYRTDDGYAHSGRLQLVRWEPQPPRHDISPSGELFEVAVPFTRTHRLPDPASTPFYRLYFQSTAWVEAAEIGADGRVWYRLLDDVLRVRYFARAEHLRHIDAQELTPLSPDVPLRAKRIEVSLAAQELRAYEEDRLVLQTRISSGIPNTEPGPNGIPTITPSGRFYVDKKTPLRHMGNGELTADPDAYELPGVPWVSFFHETGVAFHGTYWHNNFGTPMSHGCVNMATEEAKWIYRWTLPSVAPTEMLATGYGTPVVVS